MMCIKKELALTICTMQDSESKIYTHVTLLCLKSNTRQYELPNTDTLVISYIDQDLQHDGFTPRININRIMYTLH